MSRRTASSGFVFFDFTAAMIRDRSRFVFLPRLNLIATDNEPAFIPSARSDPICLVAVGLVWPLDHRHFDGHILDPIIPQGRWIIVYVLPFVLGRDRGTVRVTKTYL